MTRLYSMRVWMPPRGVERWNGRCYTCGQWNNGGWYDDGSPRFLCSHRTGEPGTAYEWVPVPE